MRITFINIRSDRRSYNCAFWNKNYLTPTLNLKVLSDFNFKYILFLNDIIIKELLMIRIII